MKAASEEPTIGRSRRPAQEPRRCAPVVVVPSRFDGACFPTLANSEKMGQTRA